MFHLYGFILSLGVVAFYWLIEFSPFFKKQKRIYSNYFFLLLLLVLIFGRLYHLLSSSNYYFHHPSEIVSFWHGGMSIIGSLIGLIIGLGTIARREKISFSALADPIFLFLPLFQALGRLANLYNHELLDKPTSLPWGIYLPPSQRPAEYLEFKYFHPLPLYELLLDLILFFFLLHQAKRNHLQPPGQLTGWYFLFYGLIRLVCQPFRGRLNNFYLFNLNLNIVFFFFFIIFGFLLIISARMKYASFKDNQIGW